MRSVLPVLVLVAQFVISPLTSHASPRDYFEIRVVDAETGRGVPLVELRTTYKQRYFTDSNGYVAFNEPDLMGLDIWFHVDSWGYKSPEGPFGTHGVQLRAERGKAGTIEIERENIAQRLYRLTGYGIYRDTRLLGKKAPIREPLLNARVAGSDTVQTAVYKGKMRWFWQDTDRVGFALGNFRMTGATTPLPNRLNPDEGISYTYFTREPNGFAKEMSAVKEETSLPIWLDGLMVVDDARRREHLIARYAAANPDLSVAHAGLMIYDDDQDLFVELERIPDHNSTRLYPGGHPTLASVDGTLYYYIAAPLPNVRVPATYESVTDLSAYEGLTCFTPGSTTELNRDAWGTLLWTWQRGVEPVRYEQIEQLIRDNRIRPEESPFRFTDTKTRNTVRVASGSIAWNPFLEKWTFLFGQQFGDSMVGEIWFATASSPEGPWVACTKVATHARKGQNMDLYNPMQHPELAGEGGRQVYFEGTFVNTFSGTSTPVPMYDYNQLMYRLDVTDPRLNLPEPPEGLSNAEPVEAGR